MAVPPSRCLRRNDHRRLHEISRRLVLLLPIPQGQRFDPSGDPATACLDRERLQPQPVSTVESDVPHQSSGKSRIANAQCIEVADSHKRLLHTHDGTDSAEPSDEHGVQLDPLLHRVESLAGYDPHICSLQDQLLDQTDERPG